MRNIVVIKKVYILMHKLGTYTKLFEGKGLLRLAESYVVAITLVQN